MCVWGERKCSLQLLSLPRGKITFSKKKKQKGKKKKKSATVLFTAIKINGAGFWGLFFFILAHDPHVETLLECKPGKKYLPSLNRTGDWPYWLEIHKTNNKISFVAVCGWSQNISICIHMPWSPHKQVAFPMAAEWLVKIYIHQMQRLAELSGSVSNGCDLPRLLFYKHSRLFWICKSFFFVQLKICFLPAYGKSQGVWDVTAVGQIQSFSTDIVH